MDNCQKCGASYALVGRVHNCRPKIVSEAAPAGPVVAAGESQSSATYKYRDPVKRRIQVARAMRDYRARKRDVRVRDGETQAEAGAAGKAV